MKTNVLCALAAVQMCSVLASAQTIDHLVGFGDSSIDSGWYKNATTGTASTDTLIANAVALGGNGAWTSAGFTSAQFLAAHFGTTALPANQQGGTNYAIGGSFAAMDNAGSGIGPATGIGAVKQIANYLAAVNGQADPNTLYLISSGGNSVNYAARDWTARSSWLTGEANALAQAVARLQAAGARTIMVVDNYTPGATDLRGTINNTFYDALMSALTSNGVRFVPSSPGSAIYGALQNPSAFGFTNIAHGVAGTANTGACVPQGGWTQSWSLLCSPATLVSANAAETYLYADSEHLSTGGARIEGDYHYSLITAPSEISYLAETAVVERRRQIDTIFEQMAMSRSGERRGDTRLWASGSITSQPMTGHGLVPSDLDAMPLALNLGADMRVAEGLIGGAAFGFGYQNADYSLGGGYRQMSFTGSLYLAYDNGPFWADLVAGYGFLTYHSEREVTIGITLQKNDGWTHGSDFSGSFEAGWKFASSTLTHGPLVGFTLQSVSVARFAEEGSFTSLWFGSQSRLSEVGTLGYQARLDLGRLTPFAELAWSYDFNSGNRQVTAALQTILAPAYALPAVKPGRSWVSPTVGAQYEMSERVSLLASFSAEIGRDKSFGGQAGVHFAL